MVKIEIKVVVLLRQFSLTELFIFTAHLKLSMPSLGEVKGVTCNHKYHEKKRNLYRNTLQDKYSRHP